jgi:hypothetical protein
MVRHPADLESELEDELELEDEFEGEFEDEFEDEFEGEFEDETEGEFEDEFEDEGEDEQFFGGVAQALGGLLGEEEGESEDEGEAFLGGIAQLAGSLLGQGEGEDEDEAEEFFGRLGRAFKKAAPFLRVLAKTAGPLVATAVGGPAAGALARAVTSQLEGEFEEELEGEFEAMASGPVSASQSMAEYFAARAAASDSETEAEAFSGAASYITISPQDRRDLERMMPALLRGSATLTRLLHSNRHTRQAVRLVPGIVDGAARTLAQRAAAGDQVGPVEVGQALGGATSRVLGDPRSRSYVMRRHARGLALARRRHGRYGSYRYGPGGGRRRRYPQGGYTSWGGPGGRARTRSYGSYRPGGYATRPYRAGGYAGGVAGSPMGRPPVRNRVVGARTQVPGPRPGFVRVVTPVRVPSRPGREPRVVRVVSDVRVPRGAVAAGRPTTVRPRR